MKAVAFRALTALAILFLAFVLYTAHALSLAQFVVVGIFIFEMGIGFAAGWIARGNR